MANPRKNHQAIKNRYSYPNHPQKSSSQRIEMRETKIAIREVELVQKEGETFNELKVTLENGTKCTISQEECAQEDWVILCDCLSAGDSMKVRSRAGIGTILSCRPNFYKKAFYVEDFHKNEQEITLRCYDDEARKNETMIVIRKTEVEEEKLIVEDFRNLFLDWEDISIVSEECAQYRFGEIRVYYIDEKMRCVQFWKY